MTCARSIFLDQLCAGAAFVVAVTSLASAAAAMRRGDPVEPSVWIANPLGQSADRSAAWHAFLALTFGMIPARGWLRLLRWGSCGGQCQVHWSRVRRVVSFVLAGVLVLAVKDTIVFYALLARGRIESSFPVPLSLFMVGLLASGLSVRRDTRFPSRSMGASIALGLGGFVAGAVGLVLLHLVTFGATDYTRSADMAVVLGARVYADGTPSLALSDRLETGIRLLQSGRVSYLVVTGGIGAEGQNEAQVMRRLAMEAGVADSKILVDEHGDNTLASAQNCRHILRQRGLSTALVVSHYYHLARCKMLFAEQGIGCATVPARMSRHLIKEPYFLLRECAAYLVYSLERPFRERHSCEPGSASSGAVIRAGTASIACDPRSL